MVQNKEKQKRNVQIVAEFKEMWNPTLKKTSVVVELARKYNLSWTYIHDIVTPKNALSEKVKRNKKIIKLYEQTVRDNPFLKTSYVVKQLAEQFGVTDGTVYSVLRNKNSENDQDKNK